jgi:hypothetical protein
LRNNLKLKNLIKEKKSINESVMSNLLGRLLTFIMSGTVKQIDNMIDPKKRRDVANAATNLRKAIESYNESLKQPDIKKQLESTGKKIEDFYINEL